MFDLNSLLKTVGYVGIFAIVFAESGLLIGFLLPGDSLLFAAGFLASQGFFNIAVLCLVCFVAAVTGDSVGYHFGKKAGPRVFKKEDSLVFNKKHIQRSEAFYQKHGGKALILARFVPVVRTFAPILAGVGGMKYTKFLVYNVVGALFWAVGVTLLGYYLGKSIPHVDQYLLPIALLIIIISVIPTLIHLVKDQERRADLMNKVSGLRRKKKNASQNK